MERRHWTFLILAGLVSMLVFCSGVAAVVNATADGDISRNRGKNRVGVVEVTGIIQDADTTLKDLRHFRDNPTIKAIVVRVDSPGGAVAPSQELHDAIAKTTETKPVVVSMGNLAASGGFYLSVGASKIFAEPGTLTGSIGVIAEMPEVDALLDAAKLKMNVYRSGKFKDLGSPFRPPTDDDRKLFQSVIDDTYDQFLHAVADGRHLKVEEVRPIADGRVLTGRQAKDLKLIDDFGGLEAAAQEAVSLAKLTGEPTLVYPTPEFKFGLREFMRDESRAAIKGTVEGVSSALRGGAGEGLLYLWPASAQ
jgi:protease-4